MSGPRRLEVPGQRLERWCAGFEERHGAVQWSVHGEQYVLRAADGSHAALKSWRSAQEPVPPSDLQGWAAAPAVFGLVLIRRGGYALGVVKHGELVSHYAGTRYVQSRTAAGGWSQQRYARRRGNQADALVGAAIAKAAGMFAPHQLTGVVLGGDKALVAQIRTEVTPHLADDVAQREFFDIPDPRHSVLLKVVDRAHRVAIDLVEST